MLSLASLLEIGCRSFTGGIPAAATTSPAEDANRSVRLFVCDLVGFIPSSAVALLGCAARLIRDGTDRDACEEYLVVGVGEHEQGVALRWDVTAASREGAECCERFGQIRPFATSAGLPPDCISPSREREADLSEGGIHRGCTMTARMRPWSSICSLELEIGGNTCHEHLAIEAASAVDAGVKARKGMVPERIARTCIADAGAATFIMAAKSSL